MTKIGTFFAGFGISWMFAIQAFIAGASDGLQKIIFVVGILFTIVCVIETKNRAT